MDNIKKHDTQKSDDKVSLEDLEIRYSELRDDDLAAGPYNHIGH